MKTMILLIRYIFVLSLVMSFQYIYAQIPEINFDKFTISDGLASNIVETVLQDRQGYLWIGAFNRLTRYNGYSFKNYYHKHNESTTLSFKFIRAICENADGKLWIGTFGGGLNLFDPESETF